MFLYLKTQFYTLLVLTGISLAFIQGALADSYDQTDRYQILEDRNLIQRRITEQRSINGIYFSLSSHISSVNFLSGASSGADSAEDYQSLFDDANGNELFSNVNLEIIIPFRKWELDEFSLTPKLYARADMGVLSVGQARSMTEEEFDAFVLNFYTDKSDIETIREILDFVTTLPAAGVNVFQHFIDAGACNTSSLLSFCNEKNAESNTPVMPADSEDKLFIYNKTQYKIGLLWDFTIVDDWTGYINIYGMQRGDNLIVMDDNAAVNASNKLSDSLSAPNNSQQFVMMDAKFQINFRPFKLHFLMEELKITRWKDSIDEYGDLYYRNTSLYQLYMTYSFYKDKISILPFAGFHKRRGYDLLDGVYLGVDLNNNRTRSRMRLMFDKNNFSIMPSVRFGQTDLIYQVHLPYSSDVGGSISTEAIHSLKLAVNFQ